MKTSFERNRRRLRRRNMHSRWLAWAQSVRRKRHRSPVGAAYSALQFLRVGRGCSFAGRWSSTSILRIYPRIHLAILVQSSLLWLAAIRSTTVRGRQAAAPDRQRQRVAQRHADRSSRPGLRPSMPPVRVLTSPELSRRIIASVRRGPPVEEVAAARRPAPVSMVSVMLRERWIKRATRTEEQVRELSEMITRRQIEIPGPRPAPPSPAPPPSPSLEDLVARMGESRRSFDTVHTAPWLKSPVPAAVNVERLTDQVIRQIDSRMVAWRERMGKV